MGRENTQHRVLVTGASRGLGLEFTRQFLARGDHVCALARRPEVSSGLKDLTRAFPDRLLPLPCDVADEGSVERARRAVEKVSDRLDLILNNAATFGAADSALETLDLEEVRRVFEVNTLGPIRVSRTFLPLLRRGFNPRLVHVTSLMGSIADNRSGGYWSYRLSKSALNMACRNLAHELREHGIPSVVLNPGWVRTEMGGPQAPLAPEEAVGALIRTIDTLTMEHSGQFFGRQGEPLPW